MTHPSLPLDPGLYVTATPIGNLEDITFRAVATLKSADLILCEDTRRTGILCAAYDISTPLYSYHDHNAARVRPEILNRLREGQRICLVSDAGTPLISDPGFKLVQAARDIGINISPIPGPCAAIAAMCVSGLPSDRFQFVGFPPSKRAARLKFFGTLSDVDATLIFYETPARLEGVLRDMETVFGQRDGAIARELTKSFEQIVSGSLSALLGSLPEIPRKGELVILIAPPTLTPPSEEEIDEQLRNYLDVMTVRDAVQATSEALGIPRKAVYERAIKLNSTS